MVRLTVRVAVKEERRLLPSFEATDLELQKERVHMGGDCS